MAPNTTAQQLEGEVVEDAGEDHLADDDGGQADDDGAPAHVHVDEALILGQQAGGERATRPLEIISPSTLVKLVLMPWARLMLGLAPVARREQPISVPKNQYRITMMATQKTAPHRMGLLYQG